MSPLGGLTLASQLKDSCQRGRNGSGGNNTSLWGLEKVIGGRGLTFQYCESATDYLL